MEETQFRNQIYWITFLFSILVVWVHSFNAELYLGAAEAAAWVERLEWILGQGLAQIAVPGFFMVSSYLFYRGFTWSKLRSKWMSRVRSVLVPYLLWNFLYYMGYVAATNVPLLSGLIGKPPVPFTVPLLANALAGHAYNPVFWYLYQLILLIALAPVIYPVMKRTLTGSAALLFIAYALWRGWDFPHLNMDALFYTCAAAFVSLHKDTWAGFAEMRPVGKKRWEYTGLLLAALGVMAVLGHTGSALYRNPLLTVCWRLWGVCSCWFILSCIRLAAARDWMKQTFFLYAVHFAWVRLINKAGAMLMPGSPAAALTMFLVMPLLIVIISTCIGRLMRVWVPGLYYVLTGGR